jgi:hypothetical protein
VQNNLRKSLHIHRNPVEFNTWTERKRSQIETQHTEENIMRKLTAKTKYKYHEDGYAIIYACRKGTTKFVPAFTCHESCIPLILKAQSFDLENVVLKPYVEA